jgi:hypothetical protein
MTFEDPPSAVNALSERAAKLDRERQAVEPAGQDLATSRRFP